MMATTALFRLGRILNKDTVQGATFLSGLELETVVA